MIDIEFIDSPERWDALSNDWDALAAAGEDDNPFRRYGWLRGWWTYFGTDRSLLILTAREEGRLIGVAPLFVEVENCPFSVRSVRFLGGTDVCSEYLGLLAFPDCEARVLPALIDFLLDELSSRWDVVRWTDIPAGSRQAAIVIDHLVERNLFHIQSAGVSNHVVQLPESWEAYVGGLRSARRTKLRGIRRAFDRLDRADLEIVADPSQFDRCWDELRRLHNDRQAAVGHAGCFTDRRFDGFHTAYARDCLGRNQLVLACLRLEGRAVAASYGFHLGETVYEYQRGLDPEQIRLRPGHALQFRLFQHAIERGVRRWDYLRGDYRHKRDWATGRRECLDLTIPAPRRAQLARYCLERAYRNTRSRLGTVRRRLNDWLHSPS